MKKSDIIYFYIMFSKKKVPPEEQAKAWKKSIREQVRGLEHQTRHIEREENKLKLKAKQLMKQGHQDAVMPIVQELVHSKKAKSKLLKTRTQLESISRQIDLQIAQVKVCGAFSQSAEVTHMLNQVVKLPELNATMVKLQQEMQKAGMAEEAVDDAIDMVQEDDEDPELAQRIVFNEIAKAVNTEAGKQKVELQPIAQEELDENQDLVKMLAH